MDLILKKRDIEDASSLAKIFGMEVQQLVEYAGDLVLQNRQCNRAMALYYLAGVTSIFHNFLVVVGQE